jgi:hypothetical protein
MKSLEKKGTNATLDHLVNSLEGAVGCDHWETYATMLCTDI